MHYIFLNDVRKFQVILNNFQNFDFIVFRNKIKIQKKKTLIKVPIKAKACFLRYHKKKTWCFQKKKTSL